ncbi:MAG: phosphate ABC transporter permease subunit PstC [Polyangiaceae bacterium]
MTSAPLAALERPGSTRPGPPGRDASRFRDLREGIVRTVLATLGGLVVLATAAVLAFIARVGVRGVAEIGVVKLVAGALWKPEAGIYGGLPLIVGTLTSAFGAVVLGALPAVVVALWVSELGPKRARAIVRRTMEIASAIPSVVFGWLALVYLVPAMEKLARGIHGADAPVTGEGLFSASVLLGVMIAPTVVLLSLDALDRVPRRLREASLALGASPLDTAIRVSAPSAWRGILVAIFFGFARAAGETMAVQMVIGGARKLPDGPFAPTTTISTQIVMDMQNAQPDTLASDALFSMALVLLVISIAVVVATRALAPKERA